jgi:hypothetical protein
MPVFEAQGENISSSCSTLSGIFTKLVCDLQLGGVICILDALDECKDDPRDELLQRIGAYFSVDPSSKREVPHQCGLKLIPTSRPYESIRIALFHHTVIRLQAEREERLINLDICRYINHEVAQLASLRGHTKDLAQVVRDSLLTGADGMFLWVSLMVKLLEKTPKKSVLQALKRLPKGIDGVYCTIESWRKFRRIQKRQSLAF